MNRAEKLVLLIVDDQEEVLEVYEDVLGEELGHQVECAYLPREALRHVRDRLFDAVIVDAKIPYRGAGLGGLILADEIGAKLGLDSVILMSQYDVRAEVAQLDSNLTFLSKPKGNTSFSEWVQKDLLAKIRRLLARQYGFVVMPFGDPASDAWYRESLVPWMADAGFAVKRMDEMATSHAMNTELQEKIRRAHFVVVYVSEQNPNVYFEAGFAVALSKFSVVCAPRIEDLPFDIRAHYALQVGTGDPERERAALIDHLHGLRGSRRV